MSVSSIVPNINTQLLLAYSDSQARRTKNMVEEKKIEEILRGTDIRDIGLQELIVASLCCKEIDSVWDLVLYGKQKLLSDPKIGPSGLKQITEQLGLLGLIMSD